MRRFLTDQRQDSGSSPPGCRRATGRCLGADTGNNFQECKKYKKGQIGLERSAS